MKPRWSLSFSPLWSSANQRASTHPSSLSNRRSTLSSLTKWSLVLSLFCLVVPTLSNPLAFLYPRGNRHAYARNIRPLPCVAKGGDSGVCMFAWDCMKANGTHLGTCIDRFYFGSCCKLDKIKRPIQLPIEEPISNTIPDTPFGKPSTVKPSFTDKHVTDNGMITPDITVTSTTKPIMTETSMTLSGVTEPNMHETEIDDEGMHHLILDNPDKPEHEFTSAGEDETGMAGLEHTDEDTNKPIGTGLEHTDEEKDKPIVTGPEPIGEDTNKPIGTELEPISVDINKPIVTGLELTDGDTDNSIDTAPASTGIEIKPPVEESEDGESTELPGFNEVIGEGQVMGEDAIIDDDDEGSGSSDYTTTKPILVDDPPESSTEPAELPDIEPATPIKPPSTNSPFDDLDKETMVSQEPVIPSTEMPVKPNDDQKDIDDNDVTTFSPVKQPSGSDEDKNDVQGIAITVIPSTEKPVKPNEDVIDKNDEDDIPSIAITVIPSTGKPVKPNEDEKEKVEDNIELTTFLPHVTDKIPVDQANIEDKTETTMFPDFGNTATQPSVTTTKSKPAVSKPDVETATDIPVEDSTFPFGIGSPLPGFPGIHVIPAAGIKPTVKPDVGDAIKITVKPDVEQTTEINIPEPSTDKINVNTLPDLIIISTTTESEKQVDPITNFPVVSIDPITNIPLVVISTTTESGKPIDPITNIPSVVISTTTESEKPSDPITNIPSVVISTSTESEKPSDPITNIPSVVISTTTESEKPSDPITNIPSVVISTTTESEKPSDPITNFPSVVMSTTTESEKPSYPITDIPVVTPTKPTTKPEPPPVTDDPTDWVPIVFPGQPPAEKPEPIGTPVVTTTEKVTTQAKPQKPEVDEVDDEDDMEVAASTTIANLVDQEMNLLDRLNSSKYSEICGRPVYPTKRIVGGSDASFGEFPWQVSLRQWRSVTFLHKCGAALLNENWAVTAAHCVENVQPEQLLLRLGEFDLETAEEPYGFVERKVQIIATHPQFDARTFEYDLALLRFYEPINFQPNVIPVCIPDDDYNYIGDTGFVSGWGRLYEDGPLPSIMQKVPVPVITNPECEAMYKVAGYVEHIPQIFICAGYEAGLKDSCEGDSGGPMVIQRDGVWNLAGVISWGIGCALPNQPGVYTRISAFREWIEKIIVF